MQPKNLYSILGITSALFGLVLSIQSVPAVTGNIIFKTLDVPAQLSFGFIFFALGLILIYHSLKKDAKHRKN